MTDPIADGMLSVLKGHIEEERRKLSQISLHNLTDMIGRVAHVDAPTKIVFRKHVYHKLLMQMLREQPNSGHYRFEGNSSFRWMTTVIQCEGE